MKQLQSLNPLALHAAALTEKLPAYHIGRALFHLNQRRGFKSNRKDGSDMATRGIISTSSRLLLEQMKLIGPQLSKEEYKALSKEEKMQARTREVENLELAINKLSGNKTLMYGAFLRKRQVEGHSTRARPGAGDRGPLYEVYPTRELYEDEFNKIWDKQAGHYPDLMNGEIRKRVHKAIFWQRDLKPATRGHCAYLPKEFRTYRAMPSFQRYRMLQELNNLEWMASGHRHRLVDHRDARDAVLRNLETVSTQKGQLVWSKMKKIIKELALVQGDFSFNFESPKRKGLDGNLTSNIMQREDYVGPVWHQWSLERQDEFIAVILDGELDDDEVELRLAKDDPDGRCCPFSGDKIGITDLFNGNADIEHLIPFSMSLDDSRANKVICARQANRDKGRRTPFRAFGNSPGDYCWTEIAARVERLPEPKQWRFQKDALEIWNKGSDFSERHLNDARYIGRLTREYLECICPFNKIDVVTGRLTALLRSHWGLNGILKDNTLSDEGHNTKTRDDRGTRARHQGQRRPSWLGRKC